MLQWLLKNFLPVCCLFALAYLVMLHHLPEHLPAISTEAPDAWCHQWALVSLHHHQPPPQANSLDQWCLLVLVEAMPEKPQHSAGWLHVYYLDRAWHRTRCRYSVCSLLDWGSVEGRRTAGYLFSLEHGAQRLLDLDASVSTVSSPPSLPSYLPVSYPASLAWSPGGEELSAAREQVPGSTVSLLQSLPGQSSLLAVGQHTFLPPASPATLYLADSLWTLLIPGSSPGWSLWSLLVPRQAGGCKNTRGWLAQRLLWRLEGGGVVAVGPPWVHTREREEREKEQDMPIDSLLDTQLDCEDVPSCMTELYSQLEMDAAFPCITKTDLQLVEAWIQDLGTVNYSLPRLRSGKRFAYLTQGGKLSASTVPRLVGSGPGQGGHYDTFYLSFRTASGDIFFPNSTFQQGRNALLRLALARQVEPGYDYFIFTDEDAKLQVVDNPKAKWKEPMASNAWQRFEEFLDHFQPKIGFGQYQTQNVSNPDQPFSITTSADPCIIAYHRSTLEFGLPFLESPLDWVSSWNENCIHIFFIKIFFSRSALQCNSVKTINGGSKYHSLKKTGEAYIYKQGFYRENVSHVIKEHINLTIYKSPLVPLFNLYDTYGMTHRPSWGEVELDPIVFNMSRTNQFGLGFNVNVFKFFNICGSFFNAQARWWKSGICRYLNSTEISAATILRQGKCGKD